MLLAHEAGHTQDLWHPDDSSDEPHWPFPGNRDINETGMDVNAKKIQRAILTDFMSSSEWISPYFWNKLLGKPYSAEWAKMSRVARAPLESHRSAQVSVQQQSVLVGGRVRVDGTGELDPLFQTLSDGPFPSTAAGAEYCVELRAGDGSTLASHCFDLSFVDRESGEPAALAGFSFVLPLPANTASLALKRGISVLAERSQSPNAPQVEAVSPEEGTEADGPTTIAWIGSDDDGDELTYAVLFSPNDGTSWYPMSFAVDGTSIVVDSAFWSGTEDGRIRVMASDGFTTSTADSGLFSVSTKDPNAYIHTPADGSFVDPAEAIILDGYADDLEDGWLSGDSLEWESDRDGYLGSGPSIILPGLLLSLGEHEITLRATDSEGDEGADSIRLFVGHRVRLPLVLK